MAATAHWSGVPYAFRVDDGAGHSLFTDEPKPIGGARGPDPVDLLLGALCTCSGTSVLTLLERMRQRVDEFTVRALVRKAVELGVTRYCPVEGTLTLGRDGCAVTYDVAIAALAPSAPPEPAGDDGSGKAAPQTAM